MAEPPRLPPADPLIGFDYGGWWRRTMTVVGAIWPRLLILQAIGAVVSVVCEAATGRLGESSGPGTAVAVAGVLVVFLVTLAVVPLMVLTASGRPATVGTCLRVIARRVLPLIGLCLLAGVMLMVGFLLLVLPGIYLLLVLTTLVPVVAVEGGWAINRCFVLFDNRRRFALARCGTVVAVMLGGGAVASLVQATLGAGLGAIVAGNLLTTAVYALVGPLSVTAYAAMRALLEPVSTEDLARQMLG
ncbi:hypothetical protein AB0G04_34950 [Actinoplanes sp. NPDC023801]|uniref:hypothetical protein n=1 Tax=Actinoplanes sp. NPDC023801 TaxID=3154595 RepID=UPI0033EDB226